MLVETYEVTELDAECQSECDAEAVALIEQLGLEGQKKLITKTDKGALRCPYRQMNARELAVYSAVCPKRTAIDKYADGPIPLRVLQVAAHARELDCIDRIEVWCPETAAEKDPVLVGIQGGDFTIQARYLLARWGEELTAFADLIPRAAAQIRDELIATCREQVGKIQARMSEAEKATETALVDGKIATPTVYMH